MSSWICPSCSNVLSFNHSSWCCSNGHVYDVAKEGYVNLLLVQHKNSKQPGDSKQMVNGRRGFLEQGHYAPLADAISGIYNQYLTQQTTQNDASFFDAGCGEGDSSDSIGWLGARHLVCGLLSDEARSVLGTVEHRCCGFHRLC